MLPDQPSLQSRFVTRSTTATRLKTEAPVEANAQGLRGPQIVRGASMSFAIVVARDSKSTSPRC